MASATHSSKSTWAAAGPGSPFSLSDEPAYRRWRAGKLEDCPRTPDALWVEVGDPGHLRPRERDAILQRCALVNMALYRTPRGAPVDKPALADMGMRLGLRRLDRNLCADEDGIASLRVADGGRPGEYIPYSDKAINWHTDGYYNDAATQVHGILMHCAAPAAAGGGNALLDPEMVYIRLRDEDPSALEALMAPDAMRIPANVENGVEIRPERAGPVFSVDPGEGSLHMRYTARTRSIVWKDDRSTRRAVARLEAAIQAEHVHTFRVRLRAGEGIVCNNVLHTRDAFRDDSRSPRLLYRARYLDRVDAPVAQTPVLLPGATHVESQ